MNKKFMYQVGNNKKVIQGTSQNKQYIEQHKNT